MAAVLSAGGSILQGQAQGQAYDFNASVLRQHASQALDQSYVRARQTENQVARRTGEAKAALAGAGVGVNTGSSLHVLSDLASQGEMARQLQLYQGKVTATSDYQQSDSDIAAGSAARTAGWITGASTLLSMSAQQGADAGWLSKGQAAMMAG